ncbi:MAG: DUF433 domain-containing protein [Cyanobacteria bacterium RI_101]|nr:DUF433 domain-containing protein [Cyanobacteria bacterium RI_101]
MTPTSDKHTEIIRTEHGLTIASTRITLYDVIEHLEAGWSPKLILNWLPLTEEQLNVALSYINANQSAVKAEYNAVLQETQERQKYWEDKNRERLAQIAKLPPKQGQEKVYAKLQAWKAKLGLMA